jgi:hypothetical protein
MLIIDSPEVLKDRQQFRPRRRILGFRYLVAIVPGH